ncbi:MAG: hypothetical protein JST54_34345 [Deltaproteobacteria bacterium]|nr:hypothetical protein [Deltaproteobacteria bacterium]
MSEPLRLEVASPCSANWDAMPGDARLRHCGACNKNVYDLSNLTRAEVEALITATEGKFCARLYQRTDGTVLTADCPKGLKDRLRDAAWSVRVRVAAIAAGLTAVLGMASSFAERPEPGPGALEPVTRLAPIDRGPQPVAQPIPPLPSAPRRSDRGRTTLQTIITGERTGQRYAMGLIRTPIEVIKGTTETQKE